MLNVTEMLCALAAAVLLAASSYICMNHGDRRLSRVCMFAGALLFAGMMAPHFGAVMAEDTAASAAEAAASTIGSKGAAYLGAAIAVGASAIGAGWAVAKAAPAAIGAISENSDNFGKAIIFVALGEGIAIYGLLISILILNNL